MTIERWDDFEIDLERRLGRGGMGALYHGRQVSLDRPCAIKVLAPELEEDTGFLKQFEVEARLAASLRHENVVTVFGAGEGGRGRFIAFEVIEGNDLAGEIQRLRREGERFADGEIAGLLIQIASALSAAHALGIVHRDIKPGNLLLTKPPARVVATAGLGIKLARRLLKVSDFGIAAAGFENRARLAELHSPLYAAPEQIDGSIGDARADIYATGVVAFELLTGHPPFQGTVGEIAAGHLLKPVEIPLADHDAELIDIIEHCLRKDPAERYPDGESLLLDLIEVGRELKQRTTFDRRPSRRFRRRSRESNEHPALPDDSGAGRAPGDSSSARSAAADDRSPAPVLATDETMPVGLSAGDGSAPAATSSNTATLAPADITAEIPVGRRPTTIAPAEPGSPLRAEPTPSGRGGHRPPTTHDSSTVMMADGSGAEPVTAARPHGRSSTHRIPLPPDDARRVACGTDHELFPDRPIGQGGMGAVYLGRQISLDRAVAIKILKQEVDEGDNSADLRARFRRESRLAARIQHPNVVAVLAAGVIADPDEDFRGLPYYAMELVAGRDIGDELADGRRFTVDETLEIMEQAALGLTAAAEFDLVHRDIKPGNLIIRDDSGAMQVKIADFGLAKDLNAAAVTQRGVVLGSLHTMAPEQARGAADARSDIYSLGVTWFQLLSGRRPFEGKTVSELLRAHREAPPPPLPDAIPAEVAAAVRRCLEKSPDKRFDSARALVDEVRRLRRESAGAAARDSGTTHARPALARPAPTERYELPSAGRGLPTAWATTVLLLCVLIAVGAARVGGERQSDWTASLIRELDFASEAARVEAPALAAIHSRIAAGRARWPRDRVLPLLAPWRETLAELDDLRERVIVRERDFPIGSAAAALGSRAEQLEQSLEAIKRELDAELPNADLRARADAGLDQLLQELRRHRARLAAAARRTPLPPGLEPVPGGVVLPPIPSLRTQATVPDFALATREVTNRDYQVFLKALREADSARLWSHPLDPKTRVEDYEPRLEGISELGAPELPVVGIDWFCAFAYAKWRGLRLVSADEWARAALGDESRPAALQPPIKDPIHWFGAPRPGAPFAAPVGTTPADVGPFGHRDLLGNVREWCSDGLPAEKSGRRLPPRYVRGVSWATLALRVDIALARTPYDPETRALDLGFRVALTP